VEGVAADTGGWNTYKSVRFPNLTLKAGVQTIKVELVGGGVNYSGIELTPPSGGAAAVAPTPAGSAVPEVEIVDVASLAGADDGFDNLKRVPTEAGWTSGTKGGMLSIMEALGLPGKAIRFQDESRTGDVWVRHEFSAVTSPYSVEFQVRFGQVADGFGVDLMNGGEVLTTVESSRGELVVLKNAKEWQPLCKYDRGVWYTIRLEVSEAGKMTVFVNNVPKAEGVALPGDARVNAWRAGSSTGTVGGMYLHYVKVTQK
jgi:hypothetical protein